MASPDFTVFLLTLSLSSLLLISPAHSLTCTSQTFTNNHLYTNCLDLPTLAAYLHWTYNPSNSSLSVAFIAPPPQPGGWIAWAINPSGAGMVGSQALVAFKQSNGSMAVQTYNVTSYAGIAKSKIAYAVSHASAEYSGGVMRLFATIALPAGMKSTVNQVWQTGPSVTNGVPDKHAFQAANLNSKAVLDLASGGGGSGSPAPAPAGEAPAPAAGGPGTSGGGGTAASAPSGGNGTTAAAAPSGGNGSGASSRVGSGSMGFVMVLFLASFVVGF